MSSGKRSKEEAAGFGAMAGGPVYPITWNEHVPVVAQAAITGKVKDKVADGIRAGWGALPGGPMIDIVTWDLDPPASGKAVGGPMLPVADLQSLAIPPPAGKAAGGPEDPEEADVGASGGAAAAEERARTRRAVERVIASAGPRVGACAGGPPAPRLVFGVPLQDLLDREGGRIPFLVAHAIDYLSRDEYAACQLTGIFRLSGATSDVDALVEAYNWGRPNVNIDAITNDAIAVAALIKMFLRELPEPLVTYELNAVFLKLSASPEVHTVAHAIAQLPHANQELICQLMIFLNTVSRFADLNKMASHNLAIVIGPNILRLPDITPLQEIAMSGKISAVSQFMIEYAYELADALGITDADRIYYDQLYPEPEPEPQPEPAQATEGLTGVSNALAGLAFSSDDDDDHHAHHDAHHDDTHGDVPPPPPPPADDPPLEATRAYADSMDWPDV